MKFGLFLKENEIAEWSDFYINYDMLNSIIEPMQDMYKSTQKTENKEKVSLNSFLLNCDENRDKFLIIANEFIEALIIELNKVLLFYTENMNFYTSRIEKISNQLKYLKDNYNINLQKYKSNDDNEKASFINLDKKNCLFTKKEYDEYHLQLELATKELFKELYLLKQFIDINSKAEDKIVKKFKKYANLCLESKTVLNIIKKNLLQYSIKIINSDTTYQQLVNKIEKVFSNYYFDKYKLNSSKVIKEYVNKTPLNNIQFYLFGIFTGVFIIILFLILILCYNYDIDMDDDKSFKQIFPIFRGIIVISFYLWILSLNTFIWDLNKVNYKKVFKFNNHFSNLSSQMTRSALLTMLTSIMILFYVVIRCNISPDILSFIYIIPLNFTPLVCWIGLFAFLFWPIKNQFNYSGRLYFFRIFKESFFQLRTDFEHVWIGNQFTSLSGVIRDLIYSILYYIFYFKDYQEFNTIIKTLQPLIIFVSMIAYFVRSTQCIKICLKNKSFYPQGFNSIKYILSIISSIASYIFKKDKEFFKIWLFWATLSSCYSFTWDVKMDWGFTILSISEFKKKFFNRSKRRIKKNSSNSKFLVKNDSFCSFKLDDLKNTNDLMLKNSFNNNKNHINNNSYDNLSVKAVILTSNKNNMLNSNSNVSYWPLRAKLSFKNKNIYYVCLVGDFIFRSFFLLSISPDIIKTFIRPEFFTMIVLMAEALRRGLWNFIRIENRHIDICKDFRSTVYVETPFFIDDNGHYRVKTKSMKKELDIVNLRLNKIKNISYIKKKKRITTLEFLNRLEDPFSNEIFRGSDPDKKHSLLSASVIRNSICIDVNLEEDQELRFSVGADDRISKLLNNHQSNASLFDVKNNDNNDRELHFENKKFNTNKSHFESNKKISNNLLYNNKLNKDNNENNLNQLSNKYNVSSIFNKNTMKSYEESDYSLDNKNSYIKPENSYKLKYNRKENEFKNYKPSNKRVNYFDTYDNELNLLNNSFNSNKSHKDQNEVYNIVNKKF